MISLDVIEREIRELEARGETVYAQCERLAWLYVCRDHLRPALPEEERTRHMEGSEFLKACSGVNFPALMKVLDEHMTATRIVQEREYERVMEQIRSLG